MNTGIVILAAGESARMGEPKQLLAYRGTTLLQHTIDTALALEAPVVVVLGAQAAKIRAELDEARVLIAENPDWQNGMGGSLRAGLGKLLAAHPDIASAMFLLCDQPLVTKATLANLIAAHDRTGRPIIASGYNDTLGVPALFARTLFPDLLALDGTAGAREIIRAHRGEAMGVPFQEGAVDIDTPGDYARLRTAPREISPPLPV